MLRGARLRTARFPCASCAGSASRRLRGPRSRRLQARAHHAADRVTPLQPDLTPAGSAMRCAGCTPQPRCVVVPPPGARAPCDACSTQNCPRTPFSEPVPAVVRHVTVTDLPWTRTRVRPRPGDHDKESVLTFQTMDQQVGKLHTCEHRGRACLWGAPCPRAQTGAARSPCSPLRAPLKPPPPAAWGLWSAVPHLAGDPHARHRGPC